ncbi:hypothetical protein CAL12_05835 [Bordetella genomosp. 8]|uniref:AB hydrolase-1 domain-containing protein n=1 Tax=Bordetella genomosp. 8 TaxID=1416806 RepID=A0A1W6YH87_9BORD|nr:alpha/beta hydrolase [Bordetella genomosp. 8]ARP80401.1 hypothetical protein CAL12_05835 [Bordetella genomosp. 8]
MHPMTAFRRPGPGPAWRKLLATATLAVSAALGTGGASWAQPVNWKEAMVCGADPRRPDAQADLTQRYVITPRGPIAYYRFGQGSPIVLVTGYRATIANWNAYFLGELARRHEVIVFDNRGIGGSGPAAGDYGIEDLARDTSTLMQTLKLRDVTMLGWSMGGMIVQTLLARQPEQVRNAVLMNTAPPGPAGAPVPEQDMRVLSGGPGVTFSQVMAVLFPANVREQADRCFARDMFRPADYGPVSVPAQVTRSQQAILRAWTVDKRAFAALDHIGVPTLVAYAKDDAILAPRNGDALLQALPGSTALEVDDAGHAMMYQYPRALARRIGEFAETGR